MTHVQHGMHNRMSTASNTGPGITHATLGSSASQVDEQKKLNSGKKETQAIIHEALHEGPEEDGFYGAVNWSRRETKKQSAFIYLRNMMKFDVALSIGVRGECTAPLCKVN